MKKFICLLLILAISITCIACSKEQKEDTQNTPTIDGSVFYDSPQYNCDIFDANYLKENDYFRIDDEEHGHIAENFELMQGKVIDLYYTSSAIYALTNDAVYCIDRFGGYINKLSIDVGNNTKIVSSNARSKNQHKYIVLKNEDNVYSVYIADIYDIKVFLKCQIDNFNPSENEQIVTYNGEGYSTINFVSFSGSNINVRSFKVVDPSDSTSVIYTNKTFTLADAQGVNIVQYVPDTFVGGNESAFLLDNGELYIVNEDWENGEQTINTVQKIDCVANVASKNEYYTYFSLEHANIDNAMFFTVRNADAEHSEELYFMFIDPNNVSKKCENVIYAENRSICIYGDGTAEYVNNNKDLLTSDTLEEKRSLFSEHYKNGNILDFAVYQDIVLVLMKDHYIYSLRIQ